MQKLAIIGTGIAGMGCANYLQHKFDITLFEKNDYAGGHTNTVYVQEGEKQIPIDSGFIVFNYENYPLLTKLFSELNVPIKKTTMSFAAQIVHDKIEYCGSSLKLLFAQKKNIFSPRYIRFLMHLNQFNSRCLEVLDEPALQVLSLRAYVRRNNWSDELLNWYLLPMSSALWSTPPETSAKFPILALVRFFKNHGFLGLNSQFQWYTVDGGSDNYKNKLLAPLKSKIKLSGEAVNIKRMPGGVELTLKDGSKMSFDKVIVAAHADDTRKILSDASARELELLTPFHYEKNKVLLHSDESVMPTLKKIWSSWNYRIEKRNGKLVSSCNYWMNSLQGVSDNKNYFVTVNDPGIVREEFKIREFEYEHPIFTVEAMQKQEQLKELNNDGRLYFCGSYFKYGFHEDALRSAVEVVKSL